jgi:toxin ParE1/3/4
VTFPRLLPAAEAELTEALDWYEDQRAGLGTEFLGSVDAALRTIGAFPERSPRWGINRSFRRHVLHRFPYALFYDLLPDGMARVVAVAHCSRKPGYWLKRTVDGAVGGSTL